MTTDNQSTAVINSVSGVMATSVGAGVLALGAMVPSFSGDGSGQNVVDFLQVLEQVAQMGGWTDPQKIGIAKCKMIGKAYAFAWHDEEVKTVTSFARFKELTLKRFDDEPENVHLERFLTARQEVGEDVRGFASRLQGLGARSVQKAAAMNADAEENAAAQAVLARQLLSLYVNGLRDPVRRFVLSQNAQTFNEAVEVAAREERNERIVTARAPVRALETRSEREIEELGQRLDRLEKLLSENIALQRGDGVREAGRTSRRPSPIICWHCGRGGHISRVCPSRAAQNGADIDRRGTQTNNARERVDRDTVQGN